MSLNLLNEKLDCDFLLISAKNKECA